MSLFQSLAQAVGIVGIVQCDLRANQLGLCCSHWPKLLALWALCSVI